MSTQPPKPSFKEQMHQAREDAILRSTCELLGEKAFDTMTMDDVANAVGIAKASLYKHFCSKEELCSAAMVQVLAGVKAYLAELPAELPPVDKLQALVRWSLQRLLANGTALLPTPNSTLRSVLMAHQGYQGALLAVSNEVDGWIRQAQAQGSISPSLPPEVVLYTLYARACDPVVGFLKEGGQYSDDQIVDLVARTCFDGLASR